MVVDFQISYCYSSGSCCCSCLSDLFKKSLLLIIQFYGKISFCVFVCTEQLHTPVTTRRWSTVLESRRKSVTFVKCLPTRLHIYVTIGIHWQQAVACDASAAQLSASQLASPGERQHCHWLYLRNISNITVCYFLWYWLWTVNHVVHGTEELWNHRIFKI